jgi:hypothetical protein
MTNNKLVFGIGTMLVLMTTLSLNTQAVIAQQQGEEKIMIPMDKMMQNMTQEELSKTIMQTVIDEIKKDNPMYANILDNIPSMSLEETVKSLLVVDDLEQLLKMHAQGLVESKSINSNQTITTK